MCMADDSFGRRIPFAFLQDIKERFLADYSRERALDSVVPYGMNEFSKTIAKQMVKQPKKKKEESERERERLRQEFAGTQRKGRKEKSKRGE